MNHPILIGSTPHLCGGVVEWQEVRAPVLVLRLARNSFSRIDEAPIAFDKTDWQPGYMTLL